MLRLFIYIFIFSVWHAHTHGRIYSKLTYYRSYDRYALLLIIFIITAAKEVL